MGYWGGVRAHATDGLRVRVSPDNVKIENKKDCVKREGSKNTAKAASGAVG